jgi:hypothetical protein
MDWFSREGRFSADQLCAGVQGYLTTIKIPPRQMQRRILLTTLLSLVGVATCLANNPPKVVIDTDFNTMGDDGQVGVMASQLYAAGAIDLLGFTIVSGNQWRIQEVADCLKTVERMGISDKVGGLCRF